MISETIDRYTPTGGPLSSFNKVGLYHQLQNAETDRTGHDVLASDIGIISFKRIKQPIWSFCRNNVPLSSHLYKEDSHWFAEIDELNLVGDGATQADAIQDLESQIRHFIEFYLKTQSDSLTGHAHTLCDKFLQIDIA